MPIRLSRKHKTAPTVGNIPRLAYCSPVNPAATGIADYSEELLPYLGQYAEITLYHDDALRPANPQLAAHLEVRPLRRLLRDQRRRAYDAVVYHMGNSAAHGQIWQAAQRLPGVIVLHDLVLHHFMLWYAANVQRNVQQYVKLMQQRYGPEGEHMAQLMIRSRFSEAAFAYPCNEEVIAAARGLLAHSRFVQQQVAAQRPNLPTALVPMGVPLPPLRSRESARAVLGLPADAFVLASFGHMNAYKRLEPTMRALLALRESVPNLRYILVGSVSPHYDVAGLVQRLGLGDVVQLAGYVSRAEFEASVAAADVCINLRHPTAGETSASLLRLLGAGRPTLVSRSGAFAELPPHVALQVDTDNSEGDLLLAYLRLLAEQPALAESIGSHARAYVASQHTLEQAAQGYIRFLARLYGWPQVRRVRSSPLWEVSPPDPLPLPPGSLASSAVAAPLDPLTGALVAQAGRALAEIGIEPGDNENRSRATSEQHLLERVGRSIIEVTEGTGERESQ